MTDACPYNHAFIYHHHYQHHYQHHYHHDYHHHYQHHYQHSHDSRQTIYLTPPCIITIKSSPLYHRHYHHHLALALTFPLYHHQYKSERKRETTSYGARIRESIEESSSYPIVILFNQHYL